MDWFTPMLTQTAVYWNSPVPDGYGGWTWAAPVEIACRWQDSSDKSVTITGENDFDGFMLWTETVMRLGGVLYLGNLTDLTPSERSDPTILNNFIRIKKTLILRSTRNERKLYKAIG
jgi:hypothetical protein